MMAGAITAQRAARAAVWAVAAALLWGLASVGPAAAQTPVEIEVSDADGHGRIVLTFPDDLPEYQIRATTGVIVVAFPETVSVDVHRIPGNMPGYVAVARLDPDGKALRMALARQVTVNTMEAGEKLFIDLLPSGWVGLPPGLPQEVVDALARRVEEAERQRAERERLERLANARPVELHIASLPTFTRFVFAWDEPVDAEITRSLDHVEIAFEDFALLDTSGFRSRLPDYVSDIGGANGDDGYVAELRVDPKSTVRGFKEGNTYVVDVTDAGVQEVRVGPAVPTSAEAASLLEGAADAEAMLLAASEAPADGISQSHRPLPVAAPEKPAAAGKAVAVAVPAASSEGAVRAEARLFGTSIRLVFPFREETPSAIFERGGALWLVFESPEEIDLKALHADIGGSVTGIHMKRTPERSVLRLDLAEPALTTATTDDTSWVITIGDMILESGPSLELRRITTEQGMPAVAVNFPEAGSVHEFADPEGGGRLTVVTALPPARGLPKAHDLVDFDALSTVQGVALVPLADDLKVEVAEGRVLIRRPGGLVLSDAVSLAGYSPAEQAVRAARPGFVDVNTEGVLDPGIVYRLIAGYVKDAAEAPVGGRTPARLRLARALLATNMGAEALGQLDLIAQEDPAVLRVPAVRALRGVALVLMHRPQEALDEFRSHGLGQSSDIALWRGMALAQLGDWRKAHRAMQQGEPALGTYSAGRQLMFGLAAARAAIEVGDSAITAVRLAQLRDLSDPGSPQVALLEGRLAEMLGDNDAALRAYEAAIRGNDQAAHVAARLRHTALAHEEGRIGIDEAVEELETLAIVWRGDEVELRTLRRLAGLLVERGDYRRGFELMKSATIADAESQVTRDLQDDMQRAFEGLFLADGADAMDPIDALALYYDYRELTPVGRKGDEVIRGLANRLVEVDLLDHATELLAHQVEHRLTGAARAQVAARLAVVHLMNRKPTEALNVIARTRQAVLPEAIRRQRAVIEARALSETGRIALALDMLASLEGTGEEVLRLKADTLWRGERWQEAAETFELVLGDVWSGPDPLDATERQAVLRCAIAYGRAGDRLGLDRLRAKFLGKMAASPDAHAFDVVTQRIASDALSFEALVEEIAATDTLEAFLTEYRERYGAGPIEPRASQS